MADERTRFEGLENELGDLDSSVFRSMLSFKVEDLIDNLDETEAAIQRTRSSISMFKDKFSEIVRDGVLETPKLISDLQFKLAKLDYTLDQWNTNFYPSLRAKHAFSASEGEDAFDDDDDEEIKNDAVISSGSSSGVGGNSSQDDEQKQSESSSGKNEFDDDEEIKNDAIIASGSSSGVGGNSSQDDEKKQSESSSGKNESDDEENTCRSDEAINKLISKIRETSIEEGSTSETVPSISIKKGSSSSSSNDQARKCDS